MSSFNLALCQLLIMVANVGTISSMSDTGSSTTLILEFKLDNIVKTMKLKSINRVLANKFLPVWITTDIPGMGFMKLNIMDELGEFTTYYDDCTKSAFVYFHKRRELSGVINISYYIKGLPIDKTKKVHTVHSQYLHHITSNERPTHELNQTIVGTMSCEDHRNSKQKMYPELLVAISHDTYTAIEQDSKFPPGIATISHVLTVYNAADMLYRSMQSVDIKLNIAGIVIESKPNEWNMESRNSDSEIYIDADFINSKISNYFWYYEYYFPRHSYDIIMYHTRHPVKDDEDDIILGLTTPTTDGYMFPLHHRRDRLNSVIRDFETYEHTKTIAHELAHIFGAAHDNEGAYGHFFDLSCGDSLMSEFRGCSESCFKWSQQTEKELAAFLRTPVHCNMKNYPRSLDVLKPKMVFSANEQCECFGHESKTGCNTKSVHNRCNIPLTCVSKCGEEVEAPLPMDGTPCGSRRVCWNGMCVQYLNMK